MVKSWREENTIIDHSQLLSCSRSVAMMARTCPAVTPFVHISVSEYPDYLGCYRHLLVQLHESESSSASAQSTVCAAFWGIKHCKIWVS